MNSLSAADVLAELQAVRQRTLRRLSGSRFWFPLCVFGAVNLAAALIGIRFGADALGWAQLIATPPTIVVVCVFFRLRARREGVTRRPWPYWLLAAAGFAGCALMGNLFVIRPVDAMPWLIVSVVYQYFALLLRSAPVAAVGVAFAVVVALFGRTAPTARPGVLTGVEGTICLIVGLAWWKRSERDPSDHEP